jgi:hypothetical protein
MLRATIENLNGNMVAKAGTLKKSKPGRVASLK